MQNFEIRVIDEFVLLGNSGIMRCSLPSFVADFIQVNSWLIIDNDESTEINVSQDNFGKQSWCHELIHNIPIPRHFPNTIKSYLLLFSPTVVKQYFEAQVYDVFVMRGNTAIFKCNLPSFVSDHVDLLEWISTENTTYKHGEDEQGAMTYFVEISRIPPTFIR